eukprot:Skav235353  [mRNA]  locus=scaffold665:8080:13321:- [translate_table: standard]
MTFSKETIIAQDAVGRVLGWRDGEALTKQDVRQILRREPEARERYDALRDPTTKKRPVEADLSLIKY